MNKAPIRVAVTGAAGQIGYALLPRIASGDTSPRTWRIGPAATPGTTGVPLRVFAGDCADVVMDTP